jgi:hypothetical protein
LVGWEGGAEKGRIYTSGGEEYAKIRKRGRSGGNGIM